MIGHNSKAQAYKAEDLRAVVASIERVEAEQKLLADHKKDIYGKAKDDGWDIRLLRAVIAERKLPENERREREEIKGLYRDALGM